MNVPEHTNEPWIIGPATPDEAGVRLDAWLARRHAALSRARWQKLIRDGAVTVEGVVPKPNDAVRAGLRAQAMIPPPQSTELVAEDIDLSILHEDPDIIVINKPPGLVVHPAPGHASGTLVNALLHHCTDLAGIGGELRPGIVHRLDRDTSGVLIIAKSESAMLALARQFKERVTRKKYLAVVWGTPSPASGTIRAAIGRDPVHRKKMSVRSGRGRPAVTHYRLRKQAAPVSLLELLIETGRTHQIRVHLAHIKHPVVGDATYGPKRPPALPHPVNRQLLHAWQLTILHPKTGEAMTFEAPVPPDIAAFGGNAATT